MSEPQSETGGTTSPIDPDGDPENVNPRDTTDDQPYEGDPDGDPDNLNARDDT